VRIPRPRPTLDDYYLQILEVLAERSTCKRRAVGAIITDERGRILGTGYNGVPRNVVHCIEQPCLGVGDKPGDNTRCIAVHAEVNAVLQTRALEDAHTIYVTCTPCFSCAKMIANTSIKRIVVRQPYADLAGERLLKQAGIKVHIIER
jgi:dCMP deaminase